MLTHPRAAVYRRSIDTKPSQPASAEDQFPSLPRPVGREDAHWLLNNYYVPRYGIDLCKETPATMRLKIQELRQSLSRIRKNTTAYQQIANQICAYERISQLLEMMPSR